MYAHIRDFLLYAACGAVALLALDWFFHGLCLSDSLKDCMQ